MNLRHKFDENMKGDSKLFITEGTSAFRHQAANKREKPQRMKHER